MCAVYGYKCACMGGVPALTMQIVMKLLLAHLICSIAILLPCLGQEPQCMWSPGCGNNCDALSGSYPFAVSSGGCIQPDLTCSSGNSIFCCDHNDYEVLQWIGSPPNCAATCSECEEQGLICFSQSRRVCTENRDRCRTGYQLLCGKKRSPSGASKVDVQGTTIIVAGVTTVLSFLRADQL